MSTDDAIEIVDFEEVEPDRYEEPGREIVQLQGEMKVPRSWAQLAVVVADGSQSMTWEIDDQSIENVHAGSKAQAVSIATSDLTSVLEGSRKAANFDFAFVAFNTQVSDRRTPTPVTELPSVASYDPTTNGTGGTRIASGLEEAYDIVQRYLQQDHHGLPASAVVLLLSDGEDSDRDAAKAAAARLKQLPNTTLAACFFATKGRPPVGADLLQELVTNLSFYKTVFTADQLRKFFHASVTAATVQS